MRLATILAPFVLSVVAAAQTSSTVITETDFGVFGRVGTATVLRAVAKNTRIAAGVPLTLSGAGAGVSATTTVNHSNTGPSVDVKSAASVNPRVRGQAGTAATTNPRAVVPAPHSLLFTIQNFGFSTIDITMLSTIVGAPRAGAQVDVGADGSVEFRQNADGKTYRKRVAVSGTSVKIRITLSGSVNAGAGYDMRVIVGPSGSSGCLISSFGASCPGTTLTATDAPAGGNHVLSMQIAQALPSASVAIVVGSKKTSVPLPGPCSLLTDQLIVVVVRADAAGKAALKATFPLTIKGTGYIQAIPYDPVKGVIFASNGLQVDCL